jgi:toxin ParE1/3/4
VTPYRVILSPEAQGDLIALYDYIAEQASPSVAARFLERVEVHVRGFAISPLRGTQRDDIRPGLRTAGFERRITIAFMVSDVDVIILRLFYGGRDWETALAEE